MVRCRSVNRVIRQYFYCPTDWQSDRFRTAKNQLILDTGNVLTLQFIDFRDSLIRQQQRNATGRLIGYSDSTIQLEVQQEHVLTYWYNGTIDDSHYWKSED